MKILYITRKFPPTVGGMETAAYELYQSLKPGNTVSLVKWGGANKFLPVIYPWLFIKALLRGWRNRPDVIYLQDGLLAPIGSILGLLTSCPTVLTLHGLDVTYRNGFYQWLFALTAKHHSRLVAVSQATAELVAAKTGRHDVAVINNGVNDEFYLDRPKADLLAQLAEATGLDQKLLSECQIIYTGGRLVKRKGVAWFIEKVMPELTKSNPKSLYIVSGNGPDQDLVKELVAKLKLDQNVKVLGYLPPHVMKLLYNVADLFVMPNIKVADDPEGFGITAVEASSCGLSVVSASLGGLRDAVIEGKNGRLVESGDAEGFERTIKAELNHPTLKRADVRKFTLDHYSWSKAAKAYVAIFAQQEQH